MKSRTPTSWLHDQCILGWIPAHRSQLYRKMAKRKSNKSSSGLGAAKSPTPRKRKILSESKQASTSNGTNLTKEMIEKLFQCPVCLTLPTGDIYQCKEGHLVCKDCYCKVKAPILCQTCRTPMPGTPIRNRVAEQVKLRGLPWSQKLIPSYSKYAFR